MPEDDLVSWTGGLGAGTCVFLVWVMGVDWGTCGAASLWQWGVLAMHALCCSLGVRDERAVLGRRYLGVQSNAGRHLVLWTGGLVAGTCAFLADWS